MRPTLRVTEIYKSIQGESSYSGFPCIFIRTSGCSLRCRWCDTVYSFQDRAPMDLDEVMAKVDALDCQLVELTGGEPLDQPETIELMARLCDASYQVLLETSGAIDISPVPKPVHIIMDIKCPGSQMADRNRLENLASLKASDEIKFVVTGREDFDWAMNLIAEHDLDRRFHILFSPAFALCQPKDLAEWVSACGRRVRMQLQIHKYIWSPKARGV